MRFLPLVEHYRHLSSLAAVIACMALAYLSHAYAATEERILLSDNADHGFCATTREGRISTQRHSRLIASCANTNSGSIYISDTHYLSPPYSYALPVTFEHLAAAQGASRSIPVAKISAPDIARQVGLGDTVRYSAAFYIAEGFDDNSWHIQMQWKGLTSNHSGQNRFWTGQNPKLAWGFHYDATIGGLHAKIIVREADPELCGDRRLTHFSTSSSNRIPFVLPARQWLLMTAVVRFDEQDGFFDLYYVHDNSNVLIASTGPINTVSQSIPSSLAKDTDRPCGTKGGSSRFMTSPTNFTFGLANYLSAASLTDAESRHILYIDNIEVALIDNASYQTRKHMVIN